MVQDVKLLLAQLAKRQFPGTLSAASALVKEVIPTSIAAIRKQARKRLIDLVITFPPLYQTNNDKQQISFSGKVWVKPFSSIYNTRNTTL
jgi:hypothetical protein